MRGARAASPSKIQQRDPFGSVPGRLQDAQDDALHADLVSLPHRAVREGRARAVAEDDLGARARGQLLVPAHEIGVEVRLDHVLDGEAVRARLLDVLVDVPPRVDDRRLPLGADEIRRVSQATQVELLEVHGRLPPHGLSRTVRTWSAGTSVTVCTRPLGQRISTESSTFAEPVPKWTGPALDEA
jgi:hypothetical protein